MDTTGTKLRDKALEIRDEMGSGSKASCNSEVADSVFESQYLGEFKPSKDRCPKCGDGEVRFYQTGRVRCVGTPKKDGCGFERK